MAEQKVAVARDWQDGLSPMAHAREHAALRDTVADEERQWRRTNGILAPDEPFDLAALIDSSNDDTDGFFLDENMGLQGRATSAPTQGAGRDPPAAARRRATPFSSTSTSTSRTRRMNNDGDEDDDEDDLEKMFQCQLHASVPRSLIASSRVVGVEDDDDDWSDTFSDEDLDENEEDEDEEGEDEDEEEEEEDEDEEDEEEEEEEEEDDEDEDEHDEDTSEGYFGQAYGDEYVEETSEEEEDGSQDSEEETSETQWEEDSSSTENEDTTDDDIQE